MPERDDENLDALAGLSVEREDVPFRKSNLKVKADTERGNRHDANIQRAEPARGKTLPVLFTLALLALIAGTGWLGYQLKIVSDELADTSASLELARSRIDELGMKVYDTDTSFNKTGNVIQEKFDFFDSEIRKLWDVSNKRNKKAIEDNRTEIERVANETKSSLQKLATLAEKAASLEQGVQKLSALVATESASARTRLEQTSQQLLVMRGEMEILLDRLADVPNNLGARVLANEEAIEAIDATRRQLINRITELQTRVNELQLSNGSAAP